MLKILFISLFLLSSCVTQGSYFPSDTSWIIKQKTNQNDVLKTLGSPYQVGIDTGVKTWTYGYYNYKLFGESYIKELKFYWNEHGTVDSYVFTSSFPEDVKVGIIKIQNKQQ